MPTTMSSSKKGASKPPPDEDSDVDIEGKIDKHNLLLCRAQCVRLSPSRVGLVSRLMRRRGVALPPSPEVEGISRNEGICGIPVFINLLVWKSINENNN
jgi:hypothetical protein